MDNETDTSTALDLPGVNGTISNLICLSTSSLEFKVDSVGFFAGESPFLFPFPILMLQMFLCLTVPRVFYYLLRPLKQPRIVAVLLFCTLISPTAMGGIKVKTGNSVKTLWSVIFPSEFEAEIRTLADTGITLYLFIIGVKMEPSIVMRSGKKTWIIALVSFLFPFMVVGVLFCFLHGKLAACLTGGPFLISLDCMLSITSFAVLSDVFSELNLLNSELGRLAMACSMVHGIFAFVLVSFNIVLGHILKGPLQAAEAIFSLWSLIFVIVFGFRPWMQSLVKKTPRGGRIDDVYIFVIFALVVALGMASDAIGAMFSILPLMMGLAVPQGPPLGSALAERGQLLANEVMMPLMFLLVALELDFTSFRAESGWLLLVLCMESCAKLVGTMASAFYCQFSLQNAFLLGLIMTFRGMVEILHFLSFMNANAPCSVGILIYPDEMAIVNPLPDSLQHQICILFWGGPDDREALSYAIRMVHRDGVSLTIVHFILPVDLRDGRQRQLDDDLLLRVQFENMGSEHVLVHQVMVRDVGQTIAAIRSLGNRYGLMIVGRRQGPNSLLDVGLSDWSECPELGVVGDMLASKDFDSASTILVMQQQN